MTSRLVVPPQIPDAVGLLAAKEHLRVIGDDDNGLIEALIRAALSRAETETGRAFAAQTWETTFNGFSAGPLLLPRAPVSSVVSITYRTGTSTTAVMDASAYYLAEWLSSWEVRPNGSWPADVAEGYGTVVVRYVAGSDYVPPDVGMAVLLMVGHWYANREAASPDSLREMPLGASAILAMHRRMFV